jgi:hypothetical protein
VFLCMVLLVILVITALVNCVAAFVYGSSNAKMKINLMLEHNIVKIQHGIRA